VLVSIRRVCCVNGVYLRGVRVLAGGFFNVVWLLPLVLFVCLGFSVFICLADDVAEIKELGRVGFWVFICCMFQVPTNTCCQILEEFL